VRSTGETSFPLLRKVLVAFGDSIAFEDTLDEALDALFGGDAGATAGDGGVQPVDPAVPADPAAPVAPTPPTTPTPTPTTPGTGATTELGQALQDARQALLDRQAAYAANDLVAAAEADKRVQAALERAFALSD